MQLVKSDGVINSSSGCLLYDINSKADHHLRLIIQCDLWCGKYGFLQNCPKYPAFRGIYLCLGVKLKTQSICFYFCHRDPLWACSSNLKEGCIRDIHFSFFIWRKTLLAPPLPQKSHLCASAGIVCKWWRHWFQPHTGLCVHAICLWGRG